MPLLLNDCRACGTTFTAEGLADLCPACKQREDREYASTTLLVADADGRPYGRRAMQERLGVSGEVDE